MTYSPSGPTIENNPFDYGNEENRRWYIDVVNKARAHQGRSLLAGIIGAFILTLTLSLFLGPRLHLRYFGGDWVEAWVTTGVAFLVVLIVMVVVALAVHSKHMARHSLSRISDAELYEFSCWALWFTTDRTLSSMVRQRASALWGDWTSELNEIGFGPDTFQGGLDPMPLNADLTVSFRLKNRTREAATNAFKGLVLAEAKSPVLFDPLVRKNSGKSYDGTGMALLRHLMDDELRTDADSEAEGVKPFDCHGPFIRQTRKANNIERSGFLSVERVAFCLDRSDKEPLLTVFRLCSESDSVSYYSKGTKVFAGSLFWFVVRDSLMRGKGRVSSAQYGTPDVPVLRL